MQVRRLMVDDAEALMALRRAALTDTPMAFLASPEDDRCADPEAVREMLSAADGSAVFGAFDPLLAGMVGVVRNGMRKNRHKAIIWGMFVAADHRRRGLAQALLEAAIAHARTWHGVTDLLLSVSTVTPGAQRLYEKLGFVAWGREPRALAHDGVIADEIHMQLPLTP